MNTKQPPTHVPVLPDLSIAHLAMDPATPLTEAPVLPARDIAEARIERPTPRCVGYRCRYSGGLYAVLGFVLVLLIFFAGIAIGTKL